MIENIILTNLLFNEPYARKVIPFIKLEYFHNSAEQLVFKLINNYIREYNGFPTISALMIDLSNVDQINDTLFKATKDYISSLVLDELSQLEWLVDQTEKFCHDKAIYNAIMASIKIIDDKNNPSTNLSEGVIPKLLQDALAVSFDTRVGHNFIEDAEERYDFYHNKDTRIPFDLDMFNRITKGGLSKKTLTVVLAGTGVGKSLFMCHCAAANLMSGLSVLYITLEMAEERIAERIDSNLFNIPLADLESMSKEEYLKKVSRIKNKTNGRLVIKEYATASAGSANFRHLINELKTKKNFVPDIIYIDYINICISSRVKQSPTVNSYTYIKSIAEELRGLATENDLPIITATQTTRGGFKSSDVGLEDTAESFGLPATADLMFALISDENLEGLDQLLVKQLKNRYYPLTSFRRFVIGVDRSKMKLYDVEQSAQDDIIGAGDVQQDKPQKRNYPKFT